MAALADPATGLANEAAMPGRPSPGKSRTAAGASRPAGPICTSASTPPAAPPTVAADFGEVYGDWTEIAGRIEAPSPAGAPERLRSEVASALRSAERDPAGPGPAAEHSPPCSTPTAPSSTRWHALADSIRRDVNGEPVTYVVNRNINFTNVCYTGCRFCAFAQRRTDADAYTLSLEQVSDRAAEAWEAGATEVCMQGGIHPDLPGSGVFRHRR